MYSGRGVVGWKVEDVRTIGGQVKCSVRSMFSCCLEVAIVFAGWSRCSQFWCCNATVYFESGPADASLDLPFSANHHKGDP